VLLGMVHAAFFTHEDQALFSTAYLPEREKAPSHPSLAGHKAPSHPSLAGHKVSLDVLVVKVIAEQHQHLGRADADLAVSQVGADLEVHQHQTRMFGCRKEGEGPRGGTAGRKEGEGPPGGTAGRKEEEGPLGGTAGATVSQSGNNRQALKSGRHTGRLILTAKTYLPTSPCSSANRASSQLTRTCNLLTHHLMAHPSCYSASL